MAFYHSIFFFFFILLSLPFLFTLTSAATCHVDDENGLLAFKSGFTDPSGLLSGWIPGTDCCSWRGTNCQADNRVSALIVYIPPDDIPNGYLSGTISSSLSKLSFLSGIYFTNLNLSGPFPDVLFHLPSLDSVYILNSNLSGPLPHNIGTLTRLRSLGLTGNRFSGKIPASISKLTNLTVLQLGNNLLTGHIPDGLRQLKYLTILTLDNNRLSGPIPDIFNTSSSPRFETINLSHNKLTGQIPGSISALALVLNFLYLDHNYLTGRIPGFLGNFQTLYFLDLSSNRFTGSVPKSFENVTVSNLNLSRNRLVDPFPALTYKVIETLDLSYNSFHFKQIPEWITTLPVINNLKLAKCGIKIKLDDWRPELAQDDEFLNFGLYIDFSDNEISGSPVGLFNTTNNLVSFKASNNRLKFDLGDLEKLRIVTNLLEELDLGRNQVFGKVTEAVIGVKNLNVSYNKLCGSLPPNKLPASAFVGNRCLCGSPLTTPCCSKCH